MGLPVKALIDLGLVLVPKLLKSKKAREEAKENAKKAAADLPSNTVAVGAVATVGALSSGVIELPASLDGVEVYGIPINIIINGVLLLGAWIYAKNFKDENE